VLDDSSARFGTACWSGEGPTKLWIKSRNSFQSATVLGAAGCSRIIRDSARRGQTRDSRAAIRSSKTSRWDGVLVPTPGSGLAMKDSIWCARSLCDAMVTAGLGSQAVTLVERAKAIRKSAYCKAGERPTPREHYDSMKVKALIDPPEKILLVDDVITKGATFAGAAARLIEAFPDAEIRAFAMARTEPQMKQVIEPRIGLISCWTDGGSVNRLVGSGPLF
jgi:hypothetical protein